MVVLLILTSLIKYQKTFVLLQKAKFCSLSNSGVSMTTLCPHMAFLSSLCLDTIVVPKHDAPCNSCQNPRGNWICISCKEVLCSSLANKHMLEHYERTNHHLACCCSEKPIVVCYSCNTLADAHQVIRQFQKISSSHKKLEKLDATMVDVAALISKPVPAINNNAVYEKPYIDHDEVALAKEELKKIFDRSLEILFDDQLQKEFLTYSTILSLADSCPLELKADLLSFRDNLTESTFTYIKARNELKEVSDLSASINQKKIVLQTEYLKYILAKKEIVVSGEKVAHLKASLATEESNIANFNEVLDLINSRVTSVKDGLVSDLAQMSSMEETINAANKLVSQQQSVWNNLRTTFTKFTEPSVISDNNQKELSLNLWLSQVI